MSKMVGASLEQSIPKPSKADQDMETEGHLRTLNDAADIMSNPQKLKRVHKLAGRRHKALAGMIEPVLAAPKIKSLSDLKAKASQPLDDDEDMES